ncbi:LuxR C-terminal-related transcriptional regulator [Nonomuraea sp. NPDC050790]|uniref:helix-turn-helix transcriptional regulator n=1 Tax=Nonomuraea sp. NPDC050790 TaxID=3364371 RepID=UPI00378CF96F
MGHVLHGRHAEQAALGALVTDAQSGRSGALVLRGEAGIGKSALLGWAASLAETAGLRVIRVTGIEAEADLAFAGLVGLLWPLQSRLDDLPEAQARALASVLGGPTGDGVPSDRFRIGLAVLTLLAELAVERPVLCLVDDAQWLDRASTDALTFAARRLGADGVAMVFAARQEGFDAPGLAELRPGRLGDEDAARVLGEYELAPGLRERVLAEAGGNPLALREFAEAAPEGGRGEPLPVADRVLAAFRAQIAVLPERTQLMLLLTAAAGPPHRPTSPNSPGSPGFPGSSGPPGPSGLSGSSGQPGVSGLPGSPAAPDISDFSGPSGSSGSQGSVGTAGSGAEGSSGSTGIAGSSGSGGFSGSWGSASRSGASGFEARDLRAVLAAGEVLGAGLDDLQPAERAALVRVTGAGIAFRHPLIATAAYRGMPMARRMAAHRALADAATDPDTRALHLSLVTIAPDEETAAELVAAAERARLRTACASAAHLYRQAAHLTPDPGRRATRLAEAAALALSGGDVNAAADLAAQVPPHTPECQPPPEGVDAPAEGADARAGGVEARGRVEGVGAWAGAARVRAAVELERGDAGDAATILVAAATSEVPVDVAAGMLRTAADYAWFAGVPDVVEVAAARLEALGRPDLAARGMAALIRGDHSQGVRLLMAAAREVGGTRAVHLGWIVGEDDATLARAAEEVARCRRYGLVGALPDVLQSLAQVQVVAGLHRDAEASVAEAAAIARATGLRQRAGQLDTVLARIAAIEGDEERCLDLTRHSTATGRVAADTMVSLLDLGLGRPERALDRLLAARQGPGGHAGVLMGATGDLVEAAVRAGRPEAAREPLRVLREWSAAGGQPWALSMAERCLALLTEDEAHFARAVRLHEGASRPFERARTELLYGEWLRRERRRADARGLLGSALETFERLRARPWAERARAELRIAGGAAATPAAADLLDRLTPQELQVVRLAAEGASSREIAAKLFLSPRTVEYHLYKAYPKLGITSRRELARLNLS